jgi:hypothetical protein
LLVDSRLGFAIEGDRWGAGVNKGADTEVLRSFQDQVGCIDVDGLVVGGLSPYASDSRCMNNRIDVMQ